jgi:hypothetical protein
MRDMRIAYAQMGGAHYNMPTITVDFLSRMSPAEVLKVFEDYVQERDVGVKRWKRWCKTCASYGIESPRAVACWGATRRAWHAGRPKPLRRPRAEADHNPPYLEDIHQQALVHIRTLGNVSLRTIDSLSPAQEHVLEELWQVLLNITYQGPASCVGISKAAMLLSEGRIGPAFDSRVRKQLNLARAKTPRDWLKKLRAIRADLMAFEDRYQVALEDLAPVEVGPLAVGRAYDVITWWHP